MNRAIFLAALALVFLAANVLTHLVGTDQASAFQGPPGSAYCGRANLDDAVTLTAFAHRVSCRYALHYAHRCLHGSSLHGWTFKGDTGALFKLTRGKSIIWLEDAGGTALCLNR